VSWVSLSIAQRLREKENEERDREKEREREDGDGDGEIEHHMATHTNSFREMWRTRWIFSVVVNSPTAHASSLPCSPHSLLSV